MKPQWANYPRKGGEAHERGRKEAQQLGNEGSKAAGGAVGAYGKQKAELKDKLEFIGQMRRSRLASLFEGGGSPNGLTEGVSYSMKGHSPSHRPQADDSPLSEGAKGTV